MKNFIKSVLILSLFVMGGESQLVLTIRNTGPTDITWVDVVINTASTYNQHWAATIRPGTSRTVTYIVPFSRDDVNKSKILQVSMNNNSTANPDGLKHFTFEMEGNNDFLYVTGSINPAQSVYQVGDTVTITPSYRNNSPTHAVTNLQAQLKVVRGPGDVANAGSPYTRSSLFPRASDSNRVSYTFTEDDIGPVDIYSYLQFRYSGATNFEQVRLMRMTVEPAEADFDVYIFTFDTHLNANTTLINSGDNVKFFVELRNTGSITIETFEIKNSDGELEASTESMAPGESGTVTIEKNIFSTTDMSFFVTAKIAEDSGTQETNSVLITVREESDTAPEESSSSTTPPEEEAGETEEEAAESEEAASSTTSEGSFLNLPDITTQQLILYILIGLIVLALIIAVIVIVSVVSKNKNKK